MLDVRQPRTPQEFEAYYDLRWRVLRAPWTQPKESEKDEYESAAVHLIAWLDGRMAGVGRVHFPAPHEAQIRYMAVEPELQGQGIGGAILEALESSARGRGVQTVVLNARSTALGFYEKHGYRATEASEVLFESIPHWRMSKAL